MLGGQLTTKEGDAMSRLMLTRRDGQAVVLSIDPAADPEKLLQLLMRDGITVGVYEAIDGSARLSFEAPREISIVRSELLADR